MRKVDAAPKRATILGMSIRSFKGDNEVVSSMDQDELQLVGDCRHMPRWLSLRELMLEQ